MADALSELSGQPPDDPEKQAIVTDFLDYTEFLPSDLFRSLSLIGKLDETYQNDADKVHVLTKQYGALPSLGPLNRPDPQTLRKEIVQNLNHALQSRESAYGEASRLCTVMDTLYDRLVGIKDKLAAMPLPPSRDPTPSVVSPNSTRSRRANVERAPRLKLFMDGEKGGPGLKSSGRKNRIRSIIVPGEVMPPFDAASPSPSAGSESEAERPPAPARKPSTPAPRRRKPSEEDAESNSDNIKLSQSGRKKSSPKKAVSQKIKIPKSRPRGMMGTNVHSTVAGISVSNAMAALTPPPEDPRPGSEWAPWLELTQWELHMVRRMMKKNANWEPSDTMKNRELVKKGRGLENLKKAQAEAKANGEEVLHQPAHHSERVAAAIEATEKLRDQVAMETGDAGDVEMQDAEPVPVPAPEPVLELTSEHAAEPSAEPPTPPPPAPEPMSEIAPETVPASEEPAPETVKNKGMALNEKKKKKREKGRKDKGLREQEAQERLRMEEASRKINDAGKSVAEFDFGSSLITLPPRGAAKKPKKRKRDSQAQKDKSVGSDAANGERSLSQAEPKTPASTEPAPKKLKLNPPASLPAPAAPPSPAPASAVSPKTNIAMTTNYVPIAPAGPVEPEPRPKKLKRKVPAASQPDRAETPSQTSNAQKAPSKPAPAEPKPVPGATSTEQNDTSAQPPPQDTANEVESAKTPTYVETPTTKAVPHRNTTTPATTRKPTNKNSTPPPTRQTRNSLSIKLTNKKAASAELTPAPASAPAAPTPSRDRRSSLRRASAASLVSQNVAAAASTPRAATASKVAQQTPGTAAGRRERRSNAGVSAAATTTATPVDKSAAGKGKTGATADKPKSKSTPTSTTAARKKSSVGSASGVAAAARRKSSSKGNIRLAGGNRRAEEEEDEEEDRWCLCGDVSHGTMVECDGGCVEQWFHVGCVGIEDLPARAKKWFCPNCRKMLGVRETGEKL
ncbi:MAG: hypothetical protein M1831_000134 [Alyxoria varia]|nr:MAG: hypothetical protein M1831_000134 [Alyxoria varia]